MRPLRIFIGYDSREPVAFHVLAHSIISRSSWPVSIEPLVQSQLRAAGIYWRERAPEESTEFSLTRFLVPHLCNYEGWAVFMDCDMLCLADVEELAAECDRAMNDTDAVAVCQHDYEPRTETKFYGQRQHKYPRKNWSSLMVFDNEKCTALTPSYVNSAPPSALHRFEWTDRVAPLPLEWNWLVGEYVPNPDAKILHYTIGGPWLHDYAGCDHSREWHEERERAFGAWNAKRRYLPPMLGAG